MEDISDSLFTMLQLQRALNDREDRDWYTKQPPFLRSAVIAAAAAMDHYGCQLWESKAPDLPQVRNDISSLPYFLLSHAMARKGRRDEELYRIAKEIETIYKALQRRDAYYDLSLPEKMELLAGKAALRDDGILWPLYFSALRDVELYWETLIRAYFSENVLKLFRQDYGQDKEAYKAAWGAKEDSIHLEEIISGMKALDLPAIRHALVMRYSILAGRRATDKSNSPKQ